MRLPSAVLTLCLAAIACGGDGGGTTTIPLPSVVSVRVSDPPATVSVGQSVQLTATALGVSGAPVTNPGSFQWTSAAPQIATVDGAGKVSTLAAGTTSISATVAGKTGSTSLSVVTTISTLPQAFVPNLVIVPVGSTVVFAFGGGITHNVIFDPSAAGKPADIQETKDVNVSRVFNTRGVFKYDCVIHPGMRGEVDVQ